MGTELIILAVIVLAVLALVALAAVAFGRFTERNEQRAYIAGILHNVEARGALDAEFRNW